MINIFISRGHTFTITPFLENWPNNVSASIRLFPYEHLHRIRSIQPGLFIFSDIDRLNSKQMESAIYLCKYIIKNYSEGLIINHPQRVLTRYPLLNCLWKKGINRFRAFTMAERTAPMKFPVFIRRNHDHKGPLTGFITNKNELDQHLDTLLSSGENPDDLLIIEFCDTKSSDGTYRKYSAFRIENRIIPAHIIFSRNWVAKDSPPEPLCDEEKIFLSDNPHREELLKIFRLANIGYGRIDYGLLDGKIQVWEINTNPILIQQHDKYDKDTFPIKQQLVDELSDAFLAAATHADNAATPENRAIIGPLLSRCYSPKCCHSQTP